jgi:acyl-CoA thioesterase-2
MGDFAKDTAVDGGEGRYCAALSPDWEIWGPMGGYVASVALRAAAREVDPSLRPASFTCQYLAPARFDLVDVAVSVRRASRRTAAVAVHVSQEATAILDAQIWFAAETEVVAHDHSRPHGHPPPEQVPLITDLTDEPPRFAFWHNFEARPLDWLDDFEAYQGGAPEWAEWLRFVPQPEFDDRVLEACRLLLLADLPSFPSASRAHPSSTWGSWIAPNLDLAVQFHRLDDLGEWLLCAGFAPVADHGLVAFRSEIWTADHRLVASGAGQLLSRMVPSAP